MVDRKTRGQRASQARKRFNQAMGGGLAPGELLKVSDKVSGYFVGHHLNEVGRNVTVDYHTEGNLNGDGRRLPESIHLGINRDEYHILYRNVAKPTPSGYEVVEGDDDRPESF